jgi:excinuclease UvrABC nuclease subunit
MLNSDHQRGASGVAPAGTEWDRILSEARHQVDQLALPEVPSEPGVHAWFREGRCVYVCETGNLRSRLRTHLSTSRDLSRSTFRSWVAVREVGRAREYTRRRPSVMTDDEIAVVTAWIRECSVAWITTNTKKDAALLKAALVAEHRPSLNAS